MISHSIKKATAILICAIKQGIGADMIQYYEIRPIDRLFCEEKQTFVVAGNTIYPSGWTTLPQQSRRDAVVASGGEGRIIPRWLCF